MTVETSDGNQWRYELGSAAWWLFIARWDHRIVRTDLQGELQEPQLHIEGQFEQPGREFVYELWFEYQRDEGFQYHSGTLYSCTRRLGPVTYERQWELEDAIKDGEDRFAESVHQSEALAMIWERKLQ